MIMDANIVEKNQRKLNMVRTYFQFCPWFRGDDEVFSYDCIFQKLFLVAEWGEMHFPLLLYSSAGTCFSHMYLILVFNISAAKAPDHGFELKQKTFFPIAVDPTKSKIRLSCGLIKTQPVQRKTPVENTAMLILLLVPVISQFLETIKKLQNCECVHGTLRH